MNYELRNLINTLSTSNFRVLIQEFNKEKYSTPHVRIVDGPYDGGNDLEVIINDNELKRNIQITVQKLNYESKLEDDLKKSKKNAENYNYLKKLDFYINQNISKEIRNKLETKAEVEYGIDLKIIDATILANEADSFKSIRKVTYDSHGVKEVDTFNSISKESKILFDILTTNKNTVEIRKNFINSFLYSFLYNNPDSNIDAIHNAINTNLESAFDKDYLFKELNYLKSKGFIQSPNEKNLYQLSTTKQDEIEKINENTLLQEYFLDKEINEFLRTKNIQCSTAELVDYIKSIFIENYQIDIDEIKNTGSSFSSSLKRSYNDLQKFLTKKGVNKKDVQKTAKELLHKCSEQEYLNKLATVSLFTNLYNSDKLEAYINNKTQTVLLDTQILIRMLCVYYKEDFEYKDAALLAVQSLIKIVRNYSDKVKLVTTTDYIEEVAGHFQEALKLQRFLNLPFVQDFGISKNVFYNVFIRYRGADVIDVEMEFDEFIEDILGEAIENYYTAVFIDNIYNRLIDLFEVAGIKIISHPVYDNYLNIKKDYEISLAYAGKERTYIAREHDLRTILYLSSSTNHVSVENGELNEPFLLTWDSAFYNFRKELLRKYKFLNYWYIYSPLKFIDRLTVRYFKIVPSSVTYNVIALAETNFNYSTKTNSFFDVISTLFNKEDVSRISILKKLANLRKDSLDIDTKAGEDESIFDIQETPITNLLLDIRNHYCSVGEQNKFSDLIKVFENNSFEDEVILILRESLKSYKKRCDLKHTYEKFNKLIEKNA